MRIDHVGAGAAAGTRGQPQQSANRPGEGAFGEALHAASDRLRLSRHAQHRVERRGLDLGESQMQRLEGAMRSAEQKGAKNSVVMLDDLAVVVDIQQRMVVTAMEREGGHDRVFTNIDSVVIA